MVNRGRGADLTTRKPTAGTIMRAMRLHCGGAARAADVLGLTGLTRITRISRTWCQGLDPRTGEQLTARLRRSPHSGLGRHRLRPQAGDRGAEGGDERIQPQLSGGR